MSLPPNGDQERERRREGRGERERERETNAIVKLLQRITFHKTRIIDTRYDILSSVPENGLLECFLRFSKLRNPNKSFISREVIIARVIYDASVRLIVFSRTVLLGFFRSRKVLWNVSRTFYP